MPAAVRDAARCRCPARSSYGALLADDVTAGFGGGATVAVPRGLGLGVTLDPDKVDRYADLYRTGGAGFAFHDPLALDGAHALPKF